MSKLLKMLKSKKIIMITIITLAVLAGIAAVWCVSILRARYVFVGTKAYKKNMTSIDLDCSFKQDMELLKKVNRFKKLEELSIVGYKEGDLKQIILQNKKLKHLYIVHSDVGDASFLNSLPSLQDVLFCETNVDFCSVNNKYVSIISIWTCDCKNLGMLKKCSSLKQLSLYRCRCDGILRKDNIIVLQDSTIFSEFDSVVELSITELDENLKIKDLNGFLKMNSLKKIDVSKNSMTKEQIDKLESAGIQVEISGE